LTGTAPSVKIKVYIITYQRPILLKRAINSLLAQTHTNWIAEVINDDPYDKSVANLLVEINDTRISLSEPVVKRGGTKNFNYAFKHAEEPYATILEDDNWYEPLYLQTMLSQMLNNTEIALAVANQKIWIENADTSWTDSGNTIWAETWGTSLYSYRLEDKCGSAKICNSSMFWRTSAAVNWLTPDDIPIDVTEHFRERIIPHPILLVKSPLVNYAQTIYTNRSKEMVWGVYQTLLISSVFANLDATRAGELADYLWAIARDKNPPYKTSLLHSGLAHPNADILLKKATLTELARYCLTWIKSPATCYKIITAIKALPYHFKFLTDNLNNSSQ
jgi:glycosyltransferase involved in cell wall biosynthesis